MITRIGVQPVIASVGGAVGRQTYRVTEIVEGVEHDPSNDVSCTNDLSIEGNFNIIHWAGEAGLFRVYRATGGLFAQIAETSESRFIDTGEA